MRTWRKFLSILPICVLIVLMGVLSQSNTRDLAEAQSNTEQVKNFNDDLKRANSHWVHNKLGRVYFDKGDYASAVEEYKKAIKIIEDAPDEYVRTDVSKEYRDSVNHELKVFSQIFPRYGLIEALAKAGRYEEALQNIDWLVQNQKVKGKEELLKQKLEGMRQNILQKMNSSQQHLVKAKTRTPENNA